MLRAAGGSIFVFAVLSKLARQMFGELQCLFAEFGNGGGFPEETFSDGTNGVEGRGRLAIRIDERAIGVDVETEEKRIGAREALRENAFDESRIHAAIIGFGSGAINDAIDAQNAFGVGVAFAK